jgi:hypothetical protein
LALLLCLGFVPLSLNAQDWHAAVQSGLVKEPVLGLLNLPDVITPDCVASTTLIQLRASASATSPTIGSLGPSGPCQLAVRRPGGASAEDLPTAESDYERPAAIVVQRDGLWFRVALQRGSAWIGRASAADFMAYPDLLTDRLSYIPSGWDGRLWDVAGTTAPRPLPAAWRPHLQREVPIAFLGSTQVGAQAWIQLRLDPSARCGDALAGDQQPLE